MAISDSVTVSIAAEMIGMLSVMFLLSRVVSRTSAGKTELLAGSRRTSSKVRASVIVGVAIGYLQCRPYINHSCNWHHEDGPIS